MPDSNAALAERLQFILGPGNWAMQHAVLFSLQRLVYRTLEASTAKTLLQHLNKLPEFDAIRDGQLTGLQRITVFLAPGCDWCWSYGEHTRDSRNTSISRQQLAELPPCAMIVYDLEALYQHTLLHRCDRARNTGSESAVD